MSLLMRIVRAVFGPLVRLIIRHVPVDDPWERLDVAPALHLYGRGSRHDFQHYLTGESHVEVKTLDDVLDWLLTCQYERDEVLFHEVDFWQHPVTFERLQAGDCEDHALWAWRKLLELGYDADLVTGRTPPEDESRHAWVVFRRDGTEYLLETTSKNRATMVRPLAEVRSEYVPEFGVGPGANRLAYSGYMLSMRSKDRRRPARRASVSRGAGTDMRGQS